MLTACKFSTPTTTDIVRIQQAFPEFKYAKEKKPHQQQNPAFFFFFFPSVTHPAHFQKPAESSATHYDDPAAAKQRNSSKSQGPTSPKKRSKLASSWSSRERKKKIISENTKQMENFQSKVNKMLLQLQQQLLENCESQVCKCLQQIKKLAKNAQNSPRAHTLSRSSSSHTLSYKAAAPIFLLLNLLVFYFTGTKIFYLSLTSLSSRPFSFVPSFFFFFTVSLSFCTELFFSHVFSLSLPLWRNPIGSVTSGFLFYFTLRYPFLSHFSPFTFLALFS